jgi:hypothetical protein
MGYKIDDKLERQIWLAKFFCLWCGRLGAMINLFALVPYLSKVYYYLPRYDAYDTSKVIYFLVTAGIFMYISGWGEEHKDIKWRCEYGRRTGKDSCG